MTLDQRQLRAFLAIVDTGSVGQAAHIVNMSQSALSRVVQATETRLSAKLFDRHFSGMSLTPYGEALVPHARLLVFEMSQAMEAIATLRRGARGTARVGAVATIARSILPGAVNRLLTKHPGVHIELLEAADDRLVTALSRREVDLVIAGELPPNDTAFAVAECRFDDSYTVFCGARHPLASRSALTLADVLAERWVMPAPGATPRILFEDLIRQAGAEQPTVAVETWSPSAIIAFVRDNSLLGWLPRPLFAGDEAAGLVTALAIPTLSLTRRFFLYRRSRGLLPTVAIQLVEQLPLLTEPSPSMLMFGNGG